MEKEEKKKFKQQHQRFKQITTQWCQNTCSAYFSHRKKYNKMNSYCYDNEFDECDSNCRSHYDDNNNNNNNNQNRLVIMQPSYLLKQNYEQLQHQQNDNVTKIVINDEVSMSKEIGKNDTTAEGAGRTLEGVSDDDADEKVDETQTNDHEDDSSSITTTTTTTGTISSNMYNELLQGSQRDQLSLQSEQQHGHHPSLSIDVPPTTTKLIDTNLYHHTNNNSLTTSSSTTRCHVTEAQLRWAQFQYKKKRQSVVQKGEDITKQEQQLQLQTSMEQYQQRNDHIKLYGYRYGYCRCTSSTCCNCDTSCTRIEQLCASFENLYYVSPDYPSRIRESYTNKSTRYSSIMNSPNNASSVCDTYTIPATKQQEHQQQCYTEKQQDDEKNSHRSTISNHTDIITHNGQSGIGRNDEEIAIRPPILPTNIVAKSNNKTSNVTKSSKLNMVWFSGRSTNKTKYAINKDHKVDKTGFDTAAAIVKECCYIDTVRFESRLMM